ncbi:MAG: hypothetical protein ACREF3_05940, partial [Acetobacteraceae bacterium]
MYVPTNPWMRTGTGLPDTDLQDAADNVLGLPLGAPIPVPGGFGTGGWGDVDMLPYVINLLSQAQYTATPVAVGQEGTSQSLFWSYDPDHGLFLDAMPGYLTTQTGNGGFRLHVRLDGSWTLVFTGSSTVVTSSDGGQPPPPPQDNTLAYPTGGGPVFYDASAGGVTFDGAGFPNEPLVGSDTVQGGVGDYMIGGTAPHQETPAGNIGNCALFTASSGSVLADMQNGQGYGGSADGDTFVNMNQVRGSLSSNVLIGSSSGTDLKSGGADSVLISTGGQGYELRPDGPDDLLVSTVGADRVLFDPSHGWQLGDPETMLGFNPNNGVYLDLT